VEISAILQVFTHEIPRIVILGAGGIGKTSLARAVLHHPEIAARYEQHRFFIACDAASTSIQLAALIGARLGLKQGEDLSHPIIHHFSSSASLLLVLDNLETIWEPRETRGELEQFLSLLTGVAHLALIVRAESDAYMVY
jgi:predicted ATPase